MINIPGVATNVLNFISENTCQVEEATLRNILLESDIADLPVVIISAVGVHRGGKSFLLNYILRYLFSTYKNNNGSWPGGADEPIRGFGWSSGSEPHTTGLLFWSEPVKVTLPSGQQVAVIIMDTQGTFDSRSSMQRSATIFGISTLISSVQIYNISMNINEDHLHHLELFAAYGALAYNSRNGKPFQKLQFLVRDWNFTGEQPCGAVGGRNLLERKLEIRENQLPELQQSRRNIRNSFEEIACYLMPHPGPNVFPGEYSGCLNGLSPEFKTYLLEFVSSLCAVDNLALSIKKINGEIIRGRDVYQYLRTYTEEFNNSVNIEPGGVLEATARAGLACAEAECLRLYRSGMRQAVWRGAAPRSEAGVRELHAQCRDRALRYFCTRRHLSDPELVADTRERLHQDIESRLQDFISINNENFTSVLTVSKAMFESQITRVSEARLLCLHPEDFVQLHRTAAQLAMNSFNEALTNEIENEKKTELETYLNERLELLRIINNANNNAAKQVSLEKYVDYMRTNCGDPPCASATRLARVHGDATAAANNLFYSKRNRACNLPNDTFKDDLDRAISEKHEEIAEANQNNNERASETVLAAYDEHMTRVFEFVSEEDEWRDEAPAASARELQAEHDAAASTARRAFVSSRHEPTDGDDSDQYIIEINQILSDKYLIFKKINDHRQVRANCAAINGYRSEMYGKCGWGMKRLTDLELDDAHKFSRNKAIDLYKSRRRFTVADTDELLIKTKEEIENAKEHHVDMNAGNPEEEVKEGDEKPWQAVAVGSMLVAASAVTVAGAVVTGPVLLGGAAVCGIASATGLFSAKKAYNLENARKRR